ncbi:MAG: type II CRISPR RNA-guided endonuclease Cas9 [Rhodospirillaceae bacterium]|nr:type II CRISPR RNA-guided endonuclease Cas9 [Rhodospirillaceae bacterium]
MHQPYRLAIDVGTNSLGWCVLDLKKTDESDGQGQPRFEPVGIRRLGVRIFPDGRDPQSGASLAASRREPRAARRRRDRYLDRRRKLMNALVRHGLMPADAAARKALLKLRLPPESACGKPITEDQVPYALRARALHEALPPCHLGRALFHLNQRRGFKSNRRTDKTADETAEKERQATKQGIDELERRIREAGCETLGEYLWLRLRDRQPVRARPHAVGSRNEYDFYPSRAMVEREFDLIWQRQTQWNTALTDAARKEIRDKIIFWQRPLKPVDPGNCTFIPTEKRAPLALPLAQEFRILQELANLEMESRVDPGLRRRLTLAQRDALLHALRTAEIAGRRKGAVTRSRNSKKEIKFDQIRALLGLDDTWAFNLEDERRTGLKWDEVGVPLSDPRCFGPRWWTEFDDDARQRIVECLLAAEDEDELLAALQREWNVTSEQARQIAAVRLPDGYGRLGATALGKIVAVMRTEADPDAPGCPIRYDEAVKLAGFAHHSDFRTGEVLDSLPYYGGILSRYMLPVTAAGAAEIERRHGRIANPTVHVGLNQLRKLVNALVGRYGPPSEIVVELARDLKMNAKQREELKEQQAENRKANERRRAVLEALEREHGLVLDTPDAMLRLRLWEELGESVVDRKCVYTGRQISARMLFSDEVDIDHILPFKRSLDDSPANLTVSLRAANRFKGNRTPYEAFSQSPTVAGLQCDWDGIWKRSQDLPRNKRWRFRADALDLVKDKAKRALLRERGELPDDVLREIDNGSAFIARQLVDTAYLARVTRQYLARICALGPDRVRVIPGGLTGLLRRKWGLNRLLYGNRPDPEEQTEGASGLAKRRDDHRHHALDAVVIGVTTPALLKRVSDAADQETRDRLIEKLPFPWEGFRDEVDSWMRRLAEGRRIAVSYKPDHGVQGKLHEETAYGPVRNDPGKSEGHNLVYRKPVRDLTFNDIDRIRDPLWRNALSQATAGLRFDESLLDAAKGRLAQARRSGDAVAVSRARAEVARLKGLKKETHKRAAKELRLVLEEFGRANRVRRLRLLKTDSSAVWFGNHDRGGFYKAVTAADNHRAEVFRRVDGSFGGEIVTVLDANRPGFLPRWREENPGAVLYDCFFKNDLVRLLVDGRERTMRVVSIWEKRLQLAGHTEANLSERYRLGELKWTFADYRKFGELRLRKLSVGLLGDVHDPGPPSA